MPWNIQGLKCVNLASNNSTHLAFNKLLDFFNNIEAFVLTLHTAIFVV